MAEIANLKPTRLDMSMEQSADPENATSTNSKSKSDKEPGASGATTTAAISPSGAAAAAMITSKNQPQGGDSTTTAAAAVKKDPPETPPPTTRGRASSSKMGISEAALNQLTNYLPSNIEMDQGTDIVRWMDGCSLVVFIFMDLTHFFFVIQLIFIAMVEHLARAAAELHQKRTGKKSTDEGLLNSPALNSDVVFHYNKDPLANTSNTNSRDGVSSNHNSHLGSPMSRSKQEQWKKVAQQASEGWTEDEEAKLKVAQRTTSDPATLAKLLGGTRNEQEILDHLKRLEELEAMEKEMLETPRKRGGRGRKPPTAAMNTVPNANYDAKALLGGDRGL